MGVLFISHSGYDNAAAVRVRDWLRANGWTDVFLDIDPSKGIAPGQKWQDELRRAGEACTAVIVLISPNWVASRWCQTEFLVAVQLGKKVFPVFIEPTPWDDLPLELRAHIQLVDISTPDKAEEGLQRLAIGLRRAGLDPSHFDWPPPGEPRRSVFRGLRALDVQDAGIFFGRDADITRGLDEMRKLRAGSPQRALVILGASGAGKSSFMRAGLIARLRRDVENFIVAPIVRPGAAAFSGPEGLLASLSAVFTQGGRRLEAGQVLPALELFRRTAAASATAADDPAAGRPPTLVIPIDQTEELFSHDQSEKADFLKLITGLLKADQDALLMLTIRSDAYERLQSESGFSQIGERLFSLPPIPTGSFQQLIERPPLLSDPPLKIQPALTHQLLGDIAGADALPLLAFTLEKLQSYATESGELTLGDYSDRLGGFSGAIQSAVDLVLGRHPDGNLLQRSRKLFIPALVQVGSAGVGRRRARLEEIPDESKKLMEAFVEQRLIVVDGGFVEIAHESILRHWPALATWVAEDLRALSALESVRIAGVEWRRRSEKKSANAWLIHRGDRLVEAISAAERPDFTRFVDPTTRNYLTASRRAERREKARRRRMQVMTAGSVLAVLLGGLVWSNWDTLEPELVRLTRYAPHARSDGDLLALRRGTTFQDCADGSEHCPRMVILPAGQALLGDPPTTAADLGFESEEEFLASGLADAGTLQRVDVPVMAVSTTEVTFGHWAACVKGGGCRQQPSPFDNGWGEADRPVINVSQLDAADYVRWLSRFTGGTYVLLTETQWQYAAAGTPAPAAPTAWAFGDDAGQLGRHAVFAENSQDRTQSVGSKLPNAFGLYDMHGNLWEWTRECETDPSDSSIRCPVRGGGWSNDPRSLRLGSRYMELQRARKTSIGIRVARVFEDQSPSP